MSVPVPVPVGAFGTSGNDAFNFRTQAEFAAAAPVDGGAGVDTLCLQYSNAVVTDANFIGWSNLEQIQLRGTGNESVTLGANAEATFGSKITVYGTKAAKLTVDASGLDSHSSVMVYAGPGKALLTGGDGDDGFAFTSQSSFTAAGRTVDGGAGNDTLYLNFDASIIDRAFGGLSHLDSLWLGGSGAQTVMLGSTASAAFDSDITVYGNRVGKLNVDARGFDPAGKILVYGSGGDDILRVGAGHETLIGGDGNDSLYFSNADTFHDVTARRVDGGAGVDDVYLDFDATLTDRDFAGISHIESMRLYGAGAQHVLLGAKAAAAFDGPVYIYAHDAGSLTVDASGLAAGTDLRVYGSDGDDVIRGGASNDILWGNVGADRFIITKGGLDQIIDFMQGDDVVQLEVPGFDSFEAIIAEAIAWAGGTKILLGDGDALLLRGIAPGSLTAEDFGFHSAPSPDPI